MNLASIYAPEIVLGAMPGNVSVTVPVDIGTARETGPSRTRFSEGGKMIEPNLKVAQNTTISAVSALERLGVGGREFRVMVAAKEAAGERRLWSAEFLDLLQADREKNNRHVLRTMVYENPYAAVPLPRDLFNGPYDERWGPIENKPLIGRIFTGPDLQKQEESKQQFNLHLGPLAKLLAKSEAKKGRMQ